MFNCACRKEFPKFVEIGQQVCIRLWKLHAGFDQPKRRPALTGMSASRSLTTYRPPWVQLVTALKALGPEAVVDVDLAAQRESLVRR